MTPDRFARLRDLVVAALRRPGEEREDLVRRGSADDDDLGREARDILAYATTMDWAADTSGIPDTELSRLVAERIEEHENQSVPERIGPYRIVAALGHGGMGVVYRATQLDPIQRDVALKLIKAGMDTRAVLARFEVERQALARMEHPAIARVFDAGATPEGRPYFVMQWVRGAPITMYCSTHRLGLRDRLTLFCEVCLGVQHAHQKGVIHRDLKPSNILVEDVDGAPQPRIIDFGIAKATHDAPDAGSLHTRQGELLGTPEYMSPEQAEGGRDVDTRTDIYSLGVILYELLTGRTPFASKALPQRSSAEVLRILREEEPTRPSATIGSRTGAESGSPVTARQVQGDLDWIVLKAMSKDRSLRYASAAGLAEDVGRYLHSEPVAAGPPGALYRLRKFARRNRVALGIATTVLLAALGVAGAAGYALIETSRQRTIAEDARDESDAVTVFLTDMLQSVRPDMAGRDVTVRETLDEAASSLDSFVDRPQLQARIQATVGIAYQGLGEHAAAERHLTPAYASRRRLLGPAAVETLQTMSALGDALDGLGRLGEAEALYREGLELARTGHGPEHQETVRFTLDLGKHYLNRFMHREAEPLLRDGVDLTRRVHGEESEEALLAANNLGHLYQQLDRRDEAESVLSTALDTSRRLRGESHPETLRLRVNLAAIHTVTGRFDLAGEALSQVLDEARRVLGDEHDLTLFAAHKTAALFQAQRRFDEAERWYTQTLAARREAFGDDHPATLAVLHDLASCHMNAGRFDEAERLFRGTLEKRRRVLGALDYWTLGTLNDLGVCLQNANRVAEAEAVYREALEGRSRSLGDLHPATYSSLYNLGWLLRRSRVGEARPLFEEMVERAAAIWGGDHPRSLAAMQHMAWIQAYFEEWESAVETWDKVWRERSRQLGEGHTDTLHSLASLAVGETRIGRYTESRRHYDELLERAPGQSTFTVNSILEFRVRRGLLDWIDGRFEQGDAELREIIPRWLERDGCAAPAGDARGDHPGLRMLEAYADCMVQTGKDQRAEDWLRHVHEIRSAIDGPGEEQTIRVARRLFEVSTKTGHSALADRLRAELRDSVE